MSNTDFVISLKFNGKEVLENVIKQLRDEYVMNIKNNFMDKLKEIQSVSESVDDMTSAMETLDNAIDKTNQSFAETAQNVEAVADGLMEINENANEQIEVQKQIKDTTDEINTGMTKGNEIAQKTSEHTKDISTKMNGVKNSIDLINENSNTWIGQLSQIGFALQGVFNILKSANAVLNNSIALARENIQAAKLIEGAVRSIGEGAGYSAQNLKDMALELQNVTNFDDNDILGKVTSRLLTFGNIQGEVFKNAQKSILDMSSYLRQDLGTSALAVGKALQDPIDGISALQKAGVIFSESQKDMIEIMMGVNDVAGAQSVILEALGEKFGGQAENLVDPVVQFKTAWIDLLGVMGGTVLPAINAIVKGLMGLVNFVSDNIKMIYGMVGVFLAYNAQLIITTIANSKLIATIKAKIVALKAEAMTTNTSIKANLVQALSIKTLGTSLKAAIAPVSLITAAKKAWLVVQLLVNKAMMANPIGLILAGVIALGVAIAALIKKFKEAKKAQEEATATDDEYKQEVDSLREAMKSKEEILLDSQTRQLQALEKAKEKGEITEKKYAEMVLHVNKTVNAQLAQLQQESIEKSINLLEKKIAVGKATYAELKVEVDKYVEHVKQMHGVESEAYLDALKKQQDLAKEMGKAREELKNSLKEFNDSMKSQTDILKTNLDKALADQREYRTANLISEAEYQANIRGLNAKYQEAAKDQKTKEHTDEIALIERKLALGMATDKELIQARSEYFQWVSGQYKQDSDAYLAMLEKKHSAEKTIINNSLSAWDSYVKEFKNRGMSITEVETEFNELLNVLNDLKNEADDHIKLEIETNIETIKQEFAHLQQVDIDKKARIKWEFDNDTAHLNDPIQARLDAQLKGLENFYASRKDMMLEAGISETEIDAQFAEAKKRLESDAMQARIDIVSSGLDTIADGLAKSGKAGFEAAKAFRIADVVMTTPSAAMKAYDSLATIPVVGPALASAAFASTIALGAVQIKEISRAKPPKAEKGGLSGLLKGASHANGGILIEAEGDEYITNKQRVKEIGTRFFDFVNFAPLEKVREFLNGFSLPVPVFANGGVISASLPVFDFPRVPKSAFIERDSYDFGRLEEQVGQMSDRLSYTLEQIKEKETNIVINAKNKSTKYMREHKRHEEIYNRRKK